MDNVNTITQANPTAKAPVKTNILFPATIWREAKKAAIDRGVSVQQFVVDLVAERLGLKDAA